MIPFDTGLIASSMRIIPSSLSTVSTIQLGCISYIPAVAPRNFLNMCGQASFVDVS